MLHTDIKNALNLYIQRSILIIAIMGFFAGLPLLMCGPIFAFWLSQSGIKLSIVGLTSIASIPYALKFLWSHFIERYNIPIIGKLYSSQKSWMILAQMLIGIGMIILGNVRPEQNIYIAVILIFLISICAATQESIMLTYDLSRLNSIEYGIGEAMRISGYRLGMLCSSITSLFIADSLGWGFAYVAIGMASLLGMLFTINLNDSFVSRKISEFPIYCNILIQSTSLFNENQYNDKYNIKFLTKKWIVHSIVDPLKEMSNKDGWIATIFLMFIYKAGDNLIGNMHNVFYSSIGFSKIEIAEISKIFGTIATIAGCFFGGFMVKKIGLGKTLLYGCIAHAIATALYIVMCYIGHNKAALYTIVFIEHFSGGFRTTALFSLRMFMCENNITALTQMAILSSLTTMGRSIFSIFSGWIVENFGWPALFISSTLCSLPALIIILYMLIIMYKDNSRYTYLQPQQEKK